MTKNWLIYGANGFTGKLIAEYAVERGQTPILAGRSYGAVQNLAGRLKLPARVFDLTAPDVVAVNINDCDAVLHCAGPFQETALPMARAAIACGCHYLDITGEIDVYRRLLVLDSQARQAKVMLLPGVGFDVVPTDCIAGCLSRDLPDATKLELAFVGPNQAASGSIKTALRQLPYGSQIRRNGALVKIPHFSKKREIMIAGQHHVVYSIPWGDVFTAYLSTGIADIAVYTGFPPEQVVALKWSQPLSALLKNAHILKLVESLVERIVPDPDDSYMSSARCLIWGEAQNAAGRSASLTISTPDTYTLTKYCAVAAVERVLQGRVTPGFQTPSLAFGADFIFSIPGVECEPKPSAHGQSS